MYVGVFLCVFVHICMYVVNKVCMYVCMCVMIFFLSTYCMYVCSIHVSKYVYVCIGVQVLDALRREFYGMLKAKNQLYVDNKIKNVRYQGVSTHTCMHTYMHIYYIYKHYC